MFHYIPYLPFPSHLSSLSISLSSSLYLSLLFGLSLTISSSSSLDIKIIRLGIGSWMFIYTQLGPYIGVTIPKLNVIDY